VLIVLMLSLGAFESYKTVGVLKSDSRDEAGRGAQSSRYPRKVKIVQVIGWNVLLSFIQAI
jgi:hypothetical protein